MIFNIYNTGFDHFGLFLGLSLLFLFVCFNYTANKKYELPFYKLSGVFFITVVFILTGAKLFTIEMREWSAFFSGGSFPSVSRSTILGALTFGPLGLLFGKKLFGIKTPFLDSLAIPVLIAMGIQRLGCLFAGCCHGLPTNSDYGVSYGPNTIAHFNFAKREWLETFSDTTSSLHPVPLYLLGICVFSALLLFRMKPKIKVEGNLFLMAIAFFILGRFFVEFLRDPLTNGSFGGIIFHLKKVQWIFLMVVTLLGTIVFVREKKFVKPDNNNISNEVNLILPITFIIVLSLFLFSIKSWFTYPEKGIMIIFCSAFSLSGLNSLLNYYFKEQLRLIPIALSLCFTIGVLPLAAQIAFNNTENESYFYSEVSVGGSFNRFSHYHKPADLNYYKYAQSNSCGGYDTVYKSYYTYHKKQTHKIITGGVSFAQYYNLGRYNRLFYKVTAYTGQDSDDDENHTDNPNPNGLNVFGLAAVIGADHKVVGGEFGIIFGNLRSSDISTGEAPNSLTSGKPESRVMPVGRLRAGFTKFVYFDIRFGHPVYGLNTPNYPITVGIGSGLGRDNGSAIHFGIGGASGEFIWAAGLKWVISKKFAAEANIQMRVGDPNVSASVSHYFGESPHKKLTRKRVD